MVTHGTAKRASSQAALLLAAERRLLATMPLHAITSAWIHRSF
jgi:hypothetical protein